MSSPSSPRAGGATLPGIGGQSLFENHLGLDAVVALADGELSLRALERASAHIAQCSECAHEVHEQEAVRRQLRSAPCPSIPSGLLATLFSIPLAAPIRTEQPSRQHDR